MQKRWFGSSAPAPVAGSKRAFALLMGLLSLGAGGATGGAAGPQALPSPSSNAAFLSLPEIAIELDPAQGGQPIKVGDALKLKVGSAPPGATAIEVQSGSTLLEDEGWNLDVQELNVTATPLKPGKRALPSLAIVDATGKQLARTSPLEFTVASAIKEDDPKPTEPVEVKPPLGLPFPTWVIVVIAAVALLILTAIGYAIWRAIQERRARSAPALPEIVRTEDEIAVIALTELESQGFLKKGEFKKHYFRVSEILKAYLGARYGFDAPECTTREMIDRMETEKLLSDTFIDQIESLFERMDRVKFTDHVPATEESSRLIESARKIVQSTRRVPVQSILPPDRAASLGGPNAVR